MIIGRIRYKLPCGWLPSVRGSIILMSCRPYGRSGASALIKIKGFLDLEDLKRHGYKLVSEVSVDRDVRIAIIRGRICPCKKAGLHKVHVIGMKGAEDHVIEVTGLFGDLREFKNLVKNLMRNNIEVLKATYREARRSDFISMKQWSLIETAFRSGFFEYPKKTSIWGLARSLGLAKSSIDESIRRGLKKIIEKGSMGSVSAL
ncbi:MAG: helix-turn-helix domain-containing protein [Sulfolobales archaeon]